MKDLIDFLSESKLPKPKRQVSISKKHKPLLQSRKLSVHENNSVLQILKNEYNNSKKNVRSAGQYTLNRTSTNLSMNSISLSNLSMMSDGSIDSFISDLDEDDEINHLIKYKNKPAHYTKFAKKDINGRNIPDTAQSAQLQSKHISPPRPHMPLAEDIQDVEELSDYLKNDSFVPQAGDISENESPSTESDVNSIDDINSTEPSEIEPISAKKSVQFTNVDVIKRDLSIEQLDELSMTDWSTSRSTQTEEIIHEEYSDLSKDELITQLKILQEENKESRDRLHLLVDENGHFIKKYDTANRVQQEMFLKHDQVMSSYTLLKSDYSTMQNTLLQTRQQVQQSNSKSLELEKLSTRALKKIKELDGENKFLSMQVDWLRNKMTNIDINATEIEEMDDSSYSSSATSMWDIKYKN
eukprot:NODE_346_length_10492_cov_0.275955.p3 type:complete len:412 gc:universal NODE_346_length_10492_cov_0.275955:1289-54(-)